MSISSPFSRFFNTLSDRLVGDDPAFLIALPLVTALREYVK
jgi:hypothetical protein